MTVQIRTICVLVHVRYNNRLEAIDKNSRLVAPWSEEDGYEAISFKPKQLDVYRFGRVIRREIFGVHANGCRLLYYKVCDLLGFFSPSVWLSLFLWWRMAVMYRNADEIRGGQTTISDSSAHHDFNITHTSILLRNLPSSFLGSPTKWKTGIRRFFFLFETHQQAKQIIDGCGYWNIIRYEGRDYGIGVSFSTCSMMISVSRVCIVPLSLNDRCPIIAF